MSGGVDVAGLRPLDREPQRVIDGALLDLVEAGQAGQDRQAGGIGRGPPGGSEMV